MDPHHKSSSRPLPDECLIMIFSFLHQDRSSLHALLTVNRQFFRLAVPILYRSPFRLLESRQESWSWPERVQRQVLLLQLLMATVQDKQKNRRLVQDQKRQLQLQQQNQYRKRSTSSSTSRRITMSSSLFAWPKMTKVPLPPQVTFGGSDPCKDRTGNADDLDNATTSFTPVSSLPTPASPSSTPVTASSPRPRLRFVSTLSKRRDWSRRRSHSKKESNVGPLQPISAQSSPLASPLLSLHSSQKDPIPEDGLALEDYLQAGCRMSIPGMYDSPRPISAADVMGTIPPSDIKSKSRPSPLAATDAAMHVDVDVSHGLSGPGSSTAKQADCYHGHDLEDGYRGSEEDYSADSDTGNETFEENCGSRGYHPTLNDDSDNDLDSASEDDIGDAPIWTSMDPFLGPFHPPMTSSSSFKDWTRVLRRQSIPSPGSEADPSTTSPSRGLMADYLYHYVEHDHPRLVRALPSVFPTVPGECFENPSLSALSFGASASFSPPHSAASSPPSHSVLNIFHSLQQPQKNARNVDMALATRHQVEHALLHHAPQRIRTLSISAPRFHALCTPRSRKQDLHQSRSPTSSFTSFVSFLSTAPFGGGTPLSTSLSSSFSSSSSSVSGTSSFSLSSRSSTSLSSASSVPWKQSMPRLCKLSRLRRIELYDIHYDFDLDAVIDFFKNHDRTFNTIREIKVGGPDDLGRSSTPGLIRILQSPKTVQLLDMVEWREGTQFMDMLPTQHLETLLLGNVRMPAHLGAAPVESEDMNLQQQQQQDDDQDPSSSVHPQILTLQRCRKLKELRMPVLINGLFEWAVEERQRRSARLSSLFQPQPSGSFHRWIPLSSWDEDDPDPVQLENVHLSGRSTGPLISTLTHVVDAFRDSLQVLQSTSWMDYSETSSCCLNLQWTWQVPQLQVLDLQGEIACRFRVHALEHCPQLRVLRLSLPHSVLYASSSLSTSEGGHCPHHGTATQEDPQNPHSLLDLFARPHSNTREIKLPRLHELKLVGEWGLDDDALLGIAEKIPTLMRLTLLRCEGVTVQGMVKALPALANLGWLEVNRAWRSELVLAVEQQRRCPLHICTPF